MRVLVVEDDKELNQFIRTALTREGFAADPASDGKAALNLARHTHYDVILLDVMMPEVSGLSVLMELRKNGDPAAILMVTSQSQERDKLAGLNEGADDYIVKPFLISELVARIRAVLRRRAGGETTGTNSVLRVGGLELDLIKHQASLKNKTLHLTKKEFELLEYFMRHPNEVISKSTLESRIWNMEFSPESNVVEVHINHLREKIGALKRPAIQTLRGIGYRFEI